jgi:uncharacterized protein
MSGIAELILPRGRSPSRTSVVRRFLVSNQVRNNAALHRFELDADGHTALAHYRLSPSTITFTHTEVPTELSGRGVGSALARGALEIVRAQGLKVVPQCPFIRAFIEKHPEFQDLLAPAG